MHCKVRKPDEFGLWQAEPTTQSLALPNASAAEVTSKTEASLLGFSAILTSEAENEPIVGRGCDQLPPHADAP